MEIQDFIVKTKLDNTDNNQQSGNPEFETNDFVFLQSKDEVQNLSDEERLVYASDYSVMNGARLDIDYSGPKRMKTTFCSLRSSHSFYEIYQVGTNGGLKYTFHQKFYEKSYICPVLNLNISSVLSAKNKFANQLKVEPVKDKSGKTIYNTITFGFYPQDKAKCSSELEFLGIGYDSFGEAAFNNDKIFYPTGKSYFGSFFKDSNGKVDITQNQEYVYKGKKYVRVISKKGDENSEFKDKTKAPKNGTEMWAEVQPIKWKILNWDELPKSINPHGSGKANTILVRSEDVILFGLPFFSANTTETRDSMWQNSVIRAYLNGYNLREELANGNGNSKYKTKDTFNFKGLGFLYEAFGDLEKAVENIIVIDEQKAPNPYNLNFEELSNDELLNYYISSNTSVFLHGASGVGKSARVKALDPTATRITLRPQMNPEEIDGTLDRATGKYIPPLWYTQLCEKCEREPNRKHVLFIDELTNVKPTVQSLVYSIVLDRAGKDGLWLLPDNAVVVAAGNETEGNQAAYPMTNALFRRFCHIYYEVDKASWLDWATGIQKTPKPLAIDESQERARIHPAILAFMISRGDEILNQELDEENPSIVTDPRKWEIASNILYATKNPNALRGAIGEELTTDFANFVKAIPISVEDVISGHYDPKMFANMQIDQKISTIMGLCNATEKKLPQVRRFIGENLGKESLANFDILWIRGNSERAEIIDEMKAEESLNKVKSMLNEFRTK